MGRNKWFETRKKSFERLRASRRSLTCYCMKLIFETGSMSSGKTLSLLSRHHELTSREVPVSLMTPSIDTRFGTGIIRSKLGVQRYADYIIKPKDDFEDLLEALPPTTEEQVDFDSRSYCNSITNLHLLVDEAQFLTEVNVEALRILADEHHVTVYCYGLRTDFQQKLFEGSKRLLELADVIIPRPSLCRFCFNDSTFNLRLDNSISDQLVLGGDEAYAAVCSRCYNERKED